VCFLLISDNGVVEANPATFPVEVVQQARWRTGLLNYLDSPWLVYIRTFQEQRVRLLSGAPPWATSPDLARILKVALVGVSFSGV
jgi:hypothetical protein